jgi:hypothetical protein
MPRSAAVRAQRSLLNPFVHLAAARERPAVNVIDYR